MNKKRSMTLRAKIAGTLLTSICAASLAISVVYYYSEKKNGMAQVDAQLLQWARHARASLPADYHDRITGPSSVSREEYERTVDRNNRRCRGFGLQYLWSVLVLDPGKIVFTSATSPGHDVKKRDHAGFFEQHRDPGAFSAALAAMKPHYSSFRNEWGWGRMVLIPERDSMGRVFMFGASVGVEELLAGQRRLALRALGLTALLLLCSLLYSLFLARLVSGPITRLSAIADEIANGRFDRPADLGGAAELESLSDSINRMSGALDQKMEALRRSEELLKKSQEISGLGSWELDLVENRLTWSDEAYRIFGLRPGEFGATYEAFLERVHPDDRAAVDGAYTGSIKEGRDVYEVDHRVVRKDTGEVRVVHEKCEHQRDAAGKIVRSVGMVHDITGRRKTENELAAHRAHLEELVKKRTAELELANSDLEAFSYSVSHDLRAPLRRINSFISLLAAEAEGALSAEAGRYMERISHSSARMSRLIDDLLNLARTGKAEPRPAEISLDEAAEEVIGELEAGLGKRRVEFRKGRLGLVRADPDMMRLVLANLLGNAVKFTAGAAAPVVELSRLAGGAGESVFRVRDNGAGFDQRYAGKLFGVFARLHSEAEFEGSGIGLASVKRIITRHGGRVWAEGEPGKGASFYFALPE